MVSFLVAHPMVAAVGYPELDGHPSRSLAQRLLPKGCGAVFSFDLKGRANKACAFIEALKLFSHLANVGDCRSLVIHPGVDHAFPHGRRGTGRGRRRAGHDPPVDRPRRSAMT